MRMNSSAEDHSNRAGFLSPRVSPDSPGLLSRKWKWEIAIVDRRSVEGRAAFSAMRRRAWTLRGTPETSHYDYRISVAADNEPSTFQYYESRESVRLREGEPRGAIEPSGEPSGARIPRCCQSRNAAFSPPASLSPLRSTPRAARKLRRSFAGCTGAAASPHRRCREGPRFAPDRSRSEFSQRDTRAEPACHRFRLLSRRVIRGWSVRLKWRSAFPRSGRHGLIVGETLGPGQLRERKAIQRPEVIPRTFTPAATSELSFPLVSSRRSFARFLPRVSLALSARTFLMHRCRNTESESAFRYARGRESRLRMALANYESRW